MRYTLITGASSGIGYQTALAFARKSKNLILVARRRERLEQLKLEIQRINPNLDVVLKTVDLSERDAIYALYEELKIYSIETLINNAGLGDSSEIIEESLRKIENQIDVNVTALAILSTLYAKDYAMVEGAQIINVSSALGYVVALGNVVYSATKFFASVYTEGLARELSAAGAQLKAKVLAPAITETEFIQVANELENFDYSKGMRMFHTAQEMAGFMIQLYESDKTLGIVSGEYEFELRDGIFPVLDRF